MLGSPLSTRQARRDGAAAVEMALLLPLLVFLCVISIDFARIFYYSVTVANCARNGALYESDSYERAESPYKNLRDAALADAGPIVDASGNPPTVSRSDGVDSAGGPYVAVTVSYHFKTVTRFPGVPNTMWVHRTVRMSVAPANPTPTNTSN